MAFFFWAIISQPLTEELAILLGLRYHTFNKRHKNGNKFQKHPATGHGPYSGRGAKELIS